MDDKKKIKQSMRSREYWGQGKVGKGSYFIQMDQGGPGSDLYSDKGTFEERDLKEVSHVIICMQVASEQIGGCLA